jgi:hypothetical protein
MVVASSMGHRFDCSLGAAQELDPSRSEQRFAQVDSRGSETERIACVYFVARALLERFNAD